MQSTHTDVVQLIKSSTQVVLTVQQKPVVSSGVAAVAAIATSTTATTTSGLQVGVVGTTSQQHQRPVSLSATGNMSPSQPATSLHRASTAPAGSAPCNTRITGPQPVDLEKKRQLETQRVHTFQLMLEKEQSYVDKLRSELAKAGTGSGNINVTAVQTELAGAERRVRTLQEQLAAISTTNEQFSQDANLSASSALSKHQRTKSSPEQLGTTAISPLEASRRLIASESMNDLLPPGHVRHNDIDINELPRTPPGTPPPPYPAPVLGQDIFSSTLNDALATDIIPGLPAFQQPIMSMEEDDVSDQEIGQLEDHGPFQSLSRLWGHHAHLAVFINYVLSNSDPSSLLFYLVTDLYKEGNAKEMKKWAYEIHSSFLVPGAPLRLHNVDENVANEIDDVLLKESDKEEILRKIFWKARTRAKEELNEQLTHFQQKRTAGLATIFGPTDISLDESISDKARETKIIETYLLPKMEPYL
ncbi:PREDICTED: rho guanine nucleotide exchange factor 12-like isoform X2 [Wasmannia auropunctata]|uniref:rho guanine nucleotide exchange factor 12-like isoform X2 n=1 Tax=Wasmannia auropunctata TaxID=64793 RepID=UPI0005EFEAFC|nr:PREDICTED: rho guanine nucleotide exchange factor 12-like isoform X2 [Wasmannia auropunctata]